MLKSGDDFPNAFHIGFAFSYDVNMIIQHLSPNTLARLHKNGWVKLQHKTDTYIIRFAKGKWFSVSWLAPDYDRKKRNHKKITVRIDDIFSFFQCSFIKAYEDIIGSVPPEITTGKAGRSSFSLDEWDDIIKYWAIETQMMRGLADELRKRVYGAGLRIKDWHGPGALASFTLRSHGIQHHMVDCGDEIRLASRYAYAGGRFELFKIGRIEGPIYGIDINSAYPNAIAKLPSLTKGEWVHVSGAEIERELRNNGRLPSFGIWKTSLRNRDRAGFELRPSPLFHRDLDHNITFPWHTNGWYHTHETYLAYREGAEILEGWAYEPATEERPFEWIADMYDTRRDWKRRGIPSQLALKLCMNSIYGKLAQRIGWDEEKQRIPPWHQLEWAGWVTSYTRAMLYSVIRRIPLQHLVAVETDGIYTTYNPDHLGISHSESLGEWEISEYKEMMYVQSGMAWLYDNEKSKWIQKRRGLDGCKDPYRHTPETCDCDATFNLNACRDYLARLGPGKEWEPFVGKTTRFVGLGQALQSKKALLDTHCVWETRPREINTGRMGKRIHVHRMCRACANGATAMEQPHDLVINSRSVLDPRSYPHDIPWGEQFGRRAWQDSQIAEDDGIYLSVS